MPAVLGYGIHGARQVIQPSLCIIYKNLNGGLKSAQNSELDIIATVISGFA